MSSTTIPHSVWPRTAFFNASWTANTPITSFWWDPFDELDWSLFESNTPTWFQWLNKPEWLNTTTMPVCPMKKTLQKWRAIIDISGFTFPLKNIKVELKPNNKLFIWGKEEVKENEENCWFKEFKKTFDLPANVESEKFVSFIWDKLLIVEVPIKDTMPNFSVKELMPVWTPEKKEISWTVTLPMPPIDPSKIDIILKDRDIVIKFWDTSLPQPHASWTTWWGAWIYKKVCSLPENTKWNELKFTFTNNVLTIWAPLWDWQMWQNKTTTTVMPTMVDWTWDWKQWSPWTANTMQWNTWNSWNKTDKTMPWSWPMNTASPMPWWPKAQ